MLVSKLRVAGKIVITFQKPLDISGALFTRITCFNIKLIWILPECIYGFLIVTWPLKARMVEPEQMSIAQQRIGNHVAVTKNEPLPGSKLLNTRCFVATDNTE
jgi:hypothetical protein